VIWKRTRQSHHNKQDPIQRSIKQADLDMLEWAAAVGDICLKYLDESGFCQWSSVGYSYFFRGQQKRQEQTPSRGRRLSILGFWEPRRSFEYGLAIGSFKGPSYIQLMDWQAGKAAHRLAQSGQITVVVQDNGSSHTCELVQPKWSEWEKQGIVPFWLPPYCSEMNQIENEWEPLKGVELAGQMFEDELDLAYAVMAGIEGRAQNGGYTVERFRFQNL
jgi:hypothetical protein